MANIYEPTAEQIAGYNEWAANLPEGARAAAQALVPWKLYRLDPAGQRVVVHSISDDGTVTVAVLGEFNRVTFERNVFGVAPFSLTECDLPGPDEELGAVLTDPADIAGFVEEIRPLVLANRDKAN